MLPDSKLLFLRQALFAKLIQLTRRSSPSRFHTPMHFSELLPWMIDVTLVAYPLSGLNWLRHVILIAAENHATAATNGVKSYGELRSQFPFLPTLCFSHAGSSWQHRMLNEYDMRSYSPGEWVRSPRVIFISRDPREVLAATYHDLRTHLNFHHIGPADMVDNNIVGVRKMASFVGRWQRWCKDNPDCLDVRYHDLRSDCATQLMRISEFCNFGFSDKTIDVACKVAALDSAHTTNAQGQSAPIRSETFLINSGRSNGQATARAQTFDELFSKSQIAQIESVLRDELDGDMTWS